MKNVVIVIETICVIGLAVVCMNFYNRLPAEIVQVGESEKTNSQENQQTKESENQIKNVENKTYGFDKNKMELKTEGSFYEDVRYD